jgi:quinol monooxygenase YgiN
MVKLGILARLEAKAGKEQELAEFLKGALPFALAEKKMISWYALQLGPSTFGIFDTFEQKEDRDAHLNESPIAKALMERAPDLLATAPVIEMIDLIAVK